MDFIDSNEIVAPRRFAAFLCEMQPAPTFMLHHISSWAGTSVAHILALGKAGITANPKVRVGG